MTKTGAVTSASSAWARLGRFNRRRVIFAAAAVIGEHLLNARLNAAHTQEANMSAEISTTSAPNPLGRTTFAEASAPGGGNVILTRDQLVARLKRAGELEVSGEDQAEIDSYFDTTRFRFHGPDGFEADYSGLTNYFEAIRAAFDDRSIRRGIIIAEGNYIACQTWIEGTFLREFTHSPAGSLPPNGQRVVWDLSNIFRFDDQGRLVEEWVRTDYRSFLRQLGASGK